MKIIKGFFMSGLMLLLPVLIWQCENKDRYYRPNLPEKLCSIGIIDADDTTHYISPIPDLLDSRSGTRYISFEKSYQIEYPEEVIDSLRGFSFSISSSEKEIFSYQSDSTMRNLKDLKLPNSILFIPGVKYYLRAKEKDSPEISAEILVPATPPELKLVSINKEITAVSENQDCAIINNQICHATIKISFNSDNRQKFYYALLLEGTGMNFTSLPPYLSGLLDFSARESNVPGFFAVMYGLKMYHMICIDRRLYLDHSQVNAFFIDGSKIPDNKCNITLSTQFHDAYSLFDAFISLRVRLLSVPEELYRFEKNLNTYKNTSGDPFSEPVYLNGNIKGGNGVFAICRSTDLKIKLSPPY
jgi:hypothetical protein